MSILMASKFMKRQMLCIKEDIIIRYLIIKVKLSFFLVITIYDMQCIVT